MTQSLKTALLGMRVAIDALTVIARSLPDTQDEAQAFAEDQLLHEVVSLEAEVGLLEAAACRYLCSAPEATQRQAPPVSSSFGPIFSPARPPPPPPPPPPPQVKAKPRPVVPADRLVTLAGPGHHRSWTMPTPAPPMAPIEEEEIELLELKAATLEALAQNPSEGSLQVRLRALGLEAYTSVQGVHVDAHVLLRGNGRWCLLGTEATPLEIAGLLADLILARPST